MQTISMRRARDLGETARSAIENLLGRKVADEEHVTVMAFPDRGAAAGEEDRTRAAQELIQDLDDLALRARHIPEEEMEALIDEAMGQARERPA